MRSLPNQGAAVLLLALAAGSATAADGGGALVGWVEDTRGVPVAGAVISLFARNTGTSFIALSDSTGRVFMPSLPAGSYTLRTLGRGHLPAPTKEVTVLPNQDSIFSVSLVPAGDLSEKEAEDRGRELHWLLRHKRRSVLESDAPVRVADARADTAPVLPRAPEIAGSFEVTTTAAALNSDATTTTDTARAGVMKLAGRFGDTGHWTLGGLLTENESAAWRMAAEFLVEPGSGHELEAGMGYGTRLLRPTVPSTTEDRGTGALFVQDRWTLGRLSTTVGARYTYVGYVTDANHVDPRVAMELDQEDGSTLHGSVGRRTLLPGGDVLTLSTLAAGPAMAFAVMDPALQPERLTRCDFGLDHKIGGTTIGGFAFYETTQDQLLNEFSGSADARTLRIENAGGAVVRGIGVSVRRQFGKVVTGSVRYTTGRAWRAAGPGDDGTVALGMPEGGFHDLSTSVETVIDRSGTRVLLLYRINTVTPEGDHASPVSNRRFDVEVRQDLPLIGALTRADWALLLAYRNLFYEANESGFLDELVTVNPPKRVVGGISVRF